MMMYYIVILFLDYGKNILIDGIFVERFELKLYYDKVIEIFNGYFLDIVEVYCFLDICCKRNVECGDRRED